MRSFGNQEMGNQVWKECGNKGRMDRTWEEEQEGGRKAGREEGTEGDRDLRGWVKGI